MRLCVLFCPADPVLPTTCCPTQVDYALSEQLREKYQLNVSFVSLVMIGFILLALVCATVMVAQQILQAARVPTIRLQRTGDPPELPFAKVTYVHNPADFNLTTLTLTNLNPPKPYVTLALILTQDLNLIQGHRWHMFLSQCAYALRTHSSISP